MLDLKSMMYFLTIVAVFRNFVIYLYRYNI